MKNLQEALVGSAEPQIVADVLESIPTERHGSVTLGVVPNQAGTVAMSVYTARILDATSVKVGFMDTEYSLAKEILLAAKESLNGFETKLIGSVFADSDISKGIDPGLMQDLAVDGKCDGWLIDTITKDGRNLLDFMEESQLRDLVFSGPSAVHQCASGVSHDVPVLFETDQYLPFLYGIPPESYLVSVCPLGTYGLLLQHPCFSKR